MDYRTGFRDGYNAAREDIMNAFGRDFLPISMESPLRLSSSPMQENAPAEKPKRKVSAYSKRYGREYKRLRRKFTLKSGSLKKGYNHKRLVRMAHAAAKKVKK